VAADLAVAELAVVVVMVVEVMVEVEKFECKVSNFHYLDQLFPE
jgi:hypothetical protein